jgi:hypothetical protein
VTDPGQVADDPATARALAAGDGWHVDVAALAVNVVAWAYAGILISAVVRAVRPGR